MVKVKTMMPQLLEVNKIAVIFLDPIKEKHIEAEAILLERLKSIHLDGNIYWEKWKVRFINEEDEEDQFGERFILCFKNSFFN